MSETIETYFARQIEWSRNTFGPALRTGGVIDHIRKELREIEAEPHDLSEWIDVVILAMDGFWRHGGSAADLLPRLLAKQQKNMARTWPDWRTMSESSARAQALDNATLRERVAALTADNERLKHDIERYVLISADETTRAEAAEAELARLTHDIERHVQIASEQATELAKRGEPGWRDMASAPKDGTRILACCQDAPDIFVVRFESYGWRDDAGRYNFLTHWLPLPAAPTAQGGA